MVRANTTRRALLGSLALLGGVTSAGCFGGGAGTPDTAPTETPTPEQTTRSQTSPRTDTPPIHTTLCGVCVDVPDLVVADGPTPEVASGSTLTVSVTFRNPYDFGVSDIGVALDAPGEKWTVAPTTVTPDPLSPGEQRPIEWAVTVPAAAAGEYTLPTVTTIRGPRKNYTVRTNELTILVTEP
jgi:hypothetical protein